MRALMAWGHVTFGRNWRRYVDGFLDEEKIARALVQTATFLGSDNLIGKRFLDVGCGSGLFSFVAHRMGATEIISFDVDADSVAATSRMFERAGSPPHWGRVPIGVEKRNGAFFRKDDHPLRAVVQDGLRRNTPWESIPARRGSWVRRAAAPWES